MAEESIMKEVQMYFVTPSGSTPNAIDDSMKVAFQEVQEAGLTPKWIDESKTLNISPSKNIVFVLKEFNKSSKVFLKLQSTESLLCGPMCVRSCLAENLPIPRNKSPVFTVAMRDVVVTASQVTQEVKAQIKERVNFMGGIYMSNLAAPVTHLVTNAVLSAKYEVAAQTGLPILKQEWVEAVWQESQVRNMKATDPDIIAQYRCPIFYKMIISASNLSKEEKKEIQKLITKNGGTFSPAMHQSETTLLVVHEAKGEKYKHARIWDLPCVRPSYIYESVAKGYAVPLSGHLVQPTVSSSTPTKEDNKMNFTYNSDSSISVIHFDSNQSRVDDTQLSNMSQKRNTQQRQPLGQSGYNYAEILNTLTISGVKKAGSFVDGCKVYLSGFSPMEEEKLTRILSVGGATVFDKLSESVSHVLLGTFVANDMRNLNTLVQKPHVVSLEWLVASVKLTAPAAEEPYYCLETRAVAPEPPSPLSQKGMQLLKPQLEGNETTMMPPPVEPTVSRKLFSEFLKENVKTPASPVKKQNQSLDVSTKSQDSVVSDLFIGKKFLLTGFTSEITEDKEEIIKLYGGSVVATNFKGVADYAVVPIDMPVPNVTALEVVTSLWLDECLEMKEVVATEYYHQPIIVDYEKQPLAGVCLTLSTYLSQEKTFLTHLAVALGAHFQDILIRVARTKENVEYFPTTHLVCPKPEGKKYDAAVKWGVTIVAKDWLLECARTNSKVPESSYIVSKNKESSIACSNSDSSTKKGTKVESGCNIEKPLTSAKNSAVHTPDNQASVMKQDMKTPRDGCETMEPSSSSKERPSPVFKTPNTVAPACEFPSTPNNSVTLHHPVVNSLKRKSSVITPDDQSPFHISTPNTPYGQFIETPSNSTKKRWKKFIEDFPSKPPSTSLPNKPRRDSTPLSELKRRAFARALETSDDDVQPPNYSIEDMEENPESGLNHSNEDPIPSNKEVNVSSRASAGWSTPSATDFKAADGTQLSKKKSADITLPEEQSAENERICQMLGQLSRRLSSTPNTLTEEKRPHPNYRQLANQPSTSFSSKPEANLILDPESQPILIGWEDPVETAERAKMLGASSPTTNKPRKFALSSVADKKEALEGKLHKLGELVCTEDEFESDTTHLIVDKLVRSEKLLCCLAGGRWVLHTSFIDRMVLCGKYVPEEEKYEWGNPASTVQLPSDDLGRQLAQAAFRWRTKVSGTANGVYQGMKVMLFTSPSKIGSYQRLIAAGGGVVLPPVLLSIKSATHCFVELKKVPNLPVPLSEMVLHKVPCLQPFFLSEMLTVSSPNMEASLIPEYKRLLASKD